jgi:hypothetical protein
MSYISPAAVNPIVQQMSSVLDGTPTGQQLRRSDAAFTASQSIVFQS